jgi:UDP-GlcNAc:undecaprenyl-phosphate GlcNAc-1-phosphate transferase
MFMGDCGAYFIGYLLATSTLSATFAGYDVPRQTIFVPIVILAVPLYDTISVIVIRLKEKRSPFVGDKSHFSHRLVELGFTKPQAVGVVYLVTTICCLGAVLLYHVNDFVGAMVIFLQVLLMLLLIAIIETKRKR